MVMPNVSSVPQLTHDVAEQALARFAQDPNEVILTQACWLREEQPHLTCLAAAMLTLLDSPFAKYDFSEGVYLTLFLLQSQAYHTGMQLPLVSADDCRAFLDQLRAEVGGTDTVMDVAERRFTTQITPGDPELAWAMNEVMRYRVEKSGLMVGIMFVYFVLINRKSHLKISETYDVVASA